MSRRHINKRAGRLARELRWELVHAAGCVYRTYAECATRLALKERAPSIYEVYEWEWAGLGVPPRPVNVPRSLRSLLGRQLGEVRRWTSADLEALRQAKGKYDALFE